MSVQDTSTTQGAIGGIGQGMQAGAAFGPTGMTIGAAVGGVIGGIGGFMSGKKKKKAAKYMKKARQIQQQREAEDYRQSLLNQIRQARINRASALAATVAAGSEQDTGAQGALSSYGSQVANIVEYMSVDRGRAVQAANYAARAGKNLSTASAIDTTTQGILNLVSSAAGAYSTYQGGQDGTTKSLSSPIIEIPGENAGSTPAERRAQMPKGSFWNP